jgi:hypothetical protein
MHNVAQSNLQSLGDSQQHIHSGNLVAALDLAHVNRVEVNFFSQSLLGQALEFPIFSDSVAQERSIFSSNHCREIEPRAGASRQIPIAIILLLRFLAKGIQPGQGARNAKTFGDSPGCLGERMNGELFVTKKSQERRGKAEQQL